MFGMQQLEKRRLFNIGVYGGNGGDPIGPGPITDLWYENDPKPDPNQPHTEAIGVYGGPGHAGTMIDVHNPDGSVAGILQVDYYCIGYMGETPGTGGQSSGNAYTGDQGRIGWSYTPGLTVDSRVGLQDKIDTTPAEDKAAGDAVAAAGGPDPVQLAGNGKAASGRTNANNVDNPTRGGSDYFGTYVAGDRNCMSFCIYIMNRATGSGIFDMYYPWPVTLFSDVMSMMERFKHRNDHPTDGGGKADGRDQMNFDSWGDPAMALV
jgi:hypothetical protein